MVDGALEDADHWWLAVGVKRAYGWSCFGAGMLVWDGGIALVFLL